MLEEFSQNNSGVNYEVLVREMYGRSVHRGEGGIKKRIFKGREGSSREHTMGGEGVNRNTKGEWRCGGRSTRKTTFKLRRKVKGAYTGAMWQK